VGGLRGGHSGLAIHENRGNSIKVLARVLERWMERAAAGGGLRVVSIEGGNKRNAIPREAAAVVLVPGVMAGEAAALAETVRAQMLTEIRTIDPGLTVTVTRIDAAPAGDAASSRRLVDLLLALPHGVVTMSRDLPGLTETSTNLGVISTTGDRVDVVTLSRSSVESALDGVLAQIRAIVRLGGAECVHGGRYSGWQPDMSSKLLVTCRDTFRALRGNDAKVTAIHAGLECGIIGERLGGGIDMISYGPWLEGVHAPGERVHIPSVARFWEFHKAVLAELA
jgi:dipeptidase D